MAGGQCRRCQAESGADLRRGRPVLDRAWPAAAWAGAGASAVARQHTRRRAPWRSCHGPARPGMQVWSHPCSTSFIGQSFLVPLPAMKVTDRGRVCGCGCLPTRQHLCVGRLLHAGHAVRHPARHRLPCLHAFCALNVLHGRAASSWPCLHALMHSQACGSGGLHG